MRSLTPLLVVAALTGATVALSTPALSRDAAAPSVLPPAAPAGQSAMYGQIRSLGRAHGRFELRFDPAWWLAGTAANRAATEDGVINPGEQVPNDYYIVDEGHRVLTFTVAPAARVTVLGTRLHQIRISVADLVQLVNGRNPKHIPLMTSVASFKDGFGFWIVIGNGYPNAVRSLDQQYRP